MFRSLYMGYRVIKALDNVLLSKMAYPINCMCCMSGHITNGIITCYDTGTRYFHVQQWTMLNANEMSSMRIPWMLIWTKIAWIRNSGFTGNYSRWNHWTLFRSAISFQKLTIIMKRQRPPCNFLLRKRGLNHPHSGFTFHA